MKLEAMENRSGTQIRKVPTICKEDPLRIEVEEIIQKVTILKITNHFGGWLFEDMYNI